MDTVTRISMSRRKHLGKTKLHGVEHEILAGDPNKEEDPEKLVVRDNPKGDGKILLDLDGAKLFKSETSRTYPLPPQLDERIETAFFHNGNGQAFRDRPRKDRVRRVRAFLAMARSMFRRNRGDKL